jgi:hypothetical protein
LKTRNTTERRGEWREKEVTAERREVEEVDGAGEAAGRRRATSARCRRRSSTSNEMRGVGNVIDQQYSLQQH